MAENDAEPQHAQQRIEELEAEYVDLYDYAAVGYLTFSGDGLIMDINRTATRLLEVERKDVLGKSFSAFVKSRSLDAFSLHLLKVLGSEEKCMCELTLARKDRTLFDGMLESIPSRVNGHPAIRTVITDITERKRTEKEKDELILQLKEALSTIRTLKGLLPICACCKKIRTSEGDWEQVEVYVRDHSEAVFSHGYCPDCIKTLYPGSVDKKT